MNKKHLVVALAILTALLTVLDEQGLIPGRDHDSAPVPSDARSLDDGLRTIAQAYRSQRSDVQVHGVGTVKKVLRDDLEGSRHQRFLLRLANRQTLLIAHNIDLAPRIEGLAKGDRVEFFGEYEWNNQGGVLHWTHHDPAGRHPDGWLRHRGRTYE